MPHDYDSQRQRTEGAFEALVARLGALPDPATLDLHFVPGACAPDPAGLARALGDAGYAVSEGADGSVDARLRLSHLSVARIWEHERMLTGLALSHGMAPDGWDLAVPRETSGGLLARLLGRGR